MRSQRGYGDWKKAMDTLAGRSDPALTPAYRSQLVTGRLKRNTKEVIGALTLTGENTYTGGTTVNDGSLIVNSSSLPGDVALANDSALVFDQLDDGTFSGIVSGDGRYRFRLTRRWGADRGVGWA